MATVQEVVDEIRFMVGGPGAVECPDSEIIKGMELAIRWLNERVPGKALSSFATVANQQDYVVKPARAFNVTAVYWADTTNEFLTTAYRYFPTGLDAAKALAGFDVVENPAIVEAFLKASEQYRQNFSGAGFETAEGKVRLVPAPGVTGTVVWFEFTYPRWDHTAEVPAEWREAFTARAAYHMATWLAVKRGVVRSGREFSGGGGQNEKEVAAEYRERADGLVCGPRMVIAKG
jgi:hypothetical protein